MEYIALLLQIYRRIRYQKILGTSQPDNNSGSRLTNSIPARYTYFHCTYIQTYNNISNQQKSIQEKQTITPFSICKKKKKNLLAPNSININVLKMIVNSVLYKTYIIKQLRYVPRDLHNISKQLDPILIRHSKTKFKFIVTSFPMEGLLRNYP